MSKYTIKTIYESLQGMKVICYTFYSLMNIAHALDMHDTAET